MGFIPSKAFQLSVVSNHIKFKWLILCPMVAKDAGKCQLRKVGNTNSEPNLVSTCSGIKLAI